MFSSKFVGQEFLQIIPNGQQDTAKSRGTLNIYLPTEEKQKQIDDFLTHVTYWALIQFIDMFPIQELPLWR